MKTGVIFPSYAHEALYYGGTWKADYPFANAGDMVRPSKVARADTTDVMPLGVLFPASRLIQAIAFVGHNVPAGASTFVVQVYSGPSHTGTLLYSATLDWWPAGGPVEGYRSIRPIILPAPVLARSLYFEIGALDAPIEIQAIEIGGFWEWPGVSYGRSLGVQGDSGSIDLAGGARSSQGDNPAIVVDGQVDLMHMGITGTTGLDFQRTLDTKQPFVWAEDFDAPASWPRRCLLARNVALPPMVGALYRHDRFPFQLKEHLR